MPDVARLKQKEDFYKRMRGVKQLVTEYLTPAARVGGALVSATKGEPLDITDTEVIEGVLSGLVGGAPGGLPAGTVGTGVTRSEALKQLGKSATLFRRPQLKGTKFEGHMRPKIPKWDIRDVAASIRRAPKEELDPILFTKYAELEPGILARNLRTAGGPRESGIQLSPEARGGEFFHELTHASSYAKRGKPSLEGYLADLLETSTEAARGLLSKISVKGKRGFYTDQPIEKHARLVPWALPKKGEITSKEFSRIFSKAAKVTIGQVKGKAPKFHKKILKEVAKGYKTRARTKRRMESEGLIKESKGTIELPGLPMKTDDIVKLIEKLPVREIKKLRKGIKRKAD